MARILVLEDDAQVRKFLTCALESEGHDVVALGDGVLARRVHEENPVDLVIADLFMPEKDGLEAISELLQHTPGLRVIAISGGGGRGDKLGAHTFLDMAARMGACHTIQKPFGRQLLSECVSSALDNVIAH